MSCVIDLAHWRQGARTLCHPAGVVLPAHQPDFLNLLAPKVCDAIRSGTHCADSISLVQKAILPGDRALIIGSGVGIVSTVVAKCRGVARVIAIEPHVTLAHHLETIHNMNGASSVEALNAVPSNASSRRIPFFARHDLLASSLDRDDGPWEQIMLVPGIDLDLILAEERINVLIGDALLLPANLLAESRLGGVDRMVLATGNGDEDSDDVRALSSRLTARGYSVRRQGFNLECDRADSVRTMSGRHAASR